MGLTNCELLRSDSGFVPYSSPLFPSPPLHLPVLPTQYSFVLLEERSAPSPMSVLSLDRLLYFTPNPDRLLFLVLLRIKFSKPLGFVAEFLAAFSFVTS